MKLFSAMTRKLLIIVNTHCASVYRVLTDWQFR